MLTVEKLKVQSRHFLTYGLGTIAQSALVFLLLPVYMKYFTPAQYGILTILLLVITFTTQFASAGIMSALHRIYFTTEGEKRKQVVGTTYYWYIFSSIVINMVIFFFARKFSYLLFETEKYFSEVRLLGIFVFISFIIEVPFNVLRLEKKAQAYVLFSLLRFFTDLILKILYIVVLQKGIWGYIFSGILSTVITTLFLAAYTYRYQSLSFNKLYLKQLLRLGIPHVFSGFAIWSLGAVDRLFLNKMVSEAAVGVYAIAFKISSIFNVVLSRPTSLMLPAVLLPFAENNPVEKTKKMISQIFNILLYVGGAVYLSIPLIMKYFIPILVKSIGIDREYLNAIGLIPIITLAPLLYFLEKPAGYSLLIVKKPEFVTISAIVAAVSNVGLNLLFIPLLKATGAALATSLSYLIYIVFTYIWANIKYPNRYEYKNAAIMTVIFAGWFLIFWLVPFENDITGLVVNLVMSIILIAFVAGKILALVKNKSFVEVVKGAYVRVFSKSITHDR